MYKKRAENIINKYAKEFDREQEERAAAAKRAEIYGGVAPKPAISNETLQYNLAVAQAKREIAAAAEKAQAEREKQNEEQKNTQRLYNYDSDRARSEAARMQHDLKARRGELEKQRSFEFADPLLTMEMAEPPKNTGRTSADIKAEIEKLEAGAKNLQTDIRSSQTVKDSVKYATAKDSPDFAKYSRAGAEIANPTVSEANTSITNWKPKEIANIVTYSRDPATQNDYAINGVSHVAGNPLYRYMTPDEVATYNYYLGKGDKTEAEKYLKYMDDVVNYRYGKETGENISNIENPVLQNLARGGYAVGAGIDQAVTGFRQLGSKDALPVTHMQYGSEVVRENIDTGFGKGAYDLVQTGANMAPSILASTITGGLGAPAAIASAVGSVTLGASAAGNAFGEARRMGYSVDQARNYAALIGASEAGLQYLMGGISKLGGTVTNGAVKSLLQSIDNALFRAAAELGVSMVGEGAEEYLQDILNPVFRNIALDEKNEFKLYSDESMYSFILGALTAGLMEGGGTAVSGLAAKNAPAPLLPQADVLNAPTPTLPQAGTLNAPAPLLPVIEQQKNPTTEPQQLGRLQSLSGSDVLAPSETNVVSSVGVTEAGGSDGTSGNVNIAQASRSVKDAIIETVREQKNPNVDTLYNSLGAVAKNGAELQKVLSDMVFETGEIGITAENTLYVVDPKQHIDNRDLSTVGRRKVNSFQYENPQLHSFFIEAANNMLHDLSLSQKGERYIVRDTDGSDIGWGGSKRQTSSQIATLLDDSKIRYTDIEMALGNIIADKGQENYAAAKRVEIMLDEMLTNGWTSLDGIRVEPNEQYIAEKNRLPGAAGAYVAQSSIDEIDAQQDEMGIRKEPVIPLGGTLRTSDIAEDTDGMTRPLNTSTAPLNRTPGALDIAKDPDEAADSYDARITDTGNNVNTLDDDALAALLEDDTHGVTQRPYGVDSELVESYYDGLMEFADRIATAQQEPRANVLTTLPATENERAIDAWDTLRSHVTDSGAAVDRIQKESGDKFIYAYYNAARASSSAAAYMITSAQTDAAGHRVGEGLKTIFDPIMEKGEQYYSDFQNYLFHMHNVDRMSRTSEERIAVAERNLNEFKADNSDVANMSTEQLRFAAEGLGSRADAAREYLRLDAELARARNITNKPVFGYDVDAETSRIEAEQLLKNNPEFEAEAQKVYAYLDNLMDYRVQSGLLSEEKAQYIRSLYPHYVPTYRVTSKQKVSMAARAKAIVTGRTVGRATGGNQDLMPLYDAMSKQTLSAVREGTKNRFGTYLLHLNDTSKLRQVTEVAEFDADAMFNENNFDDISDREKTRSGPNLYVVYENGKGYEMTVDKNLMSAVRAVQMTPDETNAMLDATRAFKKTFEKLCTSYKPTFVVTNGFKDLQDAGINARDLGSFAKNLPLAVHQIASNGEYWQLYNAMGGVYSSIFGDKTPLTESKAGRLKKATLAKLETLNMAVEQMPRMAEFMSVLDKGGGIEGYSMDTLMDAMHAAAEVTVNFGRSGTAVRWANRNFAPFLNAQVQGLSRNVRRIANTHGFKEWAKLAGRFALFGIAPTVLTAFLFGGGDDEDTEYDKLRQSDKDNYFLFPIGDSRWIRIPKGRMSAAIGTATNRVLSAMDGEKVDIIQAGADALRPLLPENPLTNNLLSGWSDAALFDADNPGRTWYGANIESQRMLQHRPGQRYDEGTDYLSRTLGNWLNLSPAKINYILDQYSGVLGDYLLPLMTPETMGDDVWSSIGKTLRAPFYIDAVRSNETAGKFYDAADELKYRKNEEGGAVQLVNRFMNRQTDAVGELNKEIRAIENDMRLKGGEKSDMVRAGKASVNVIEELALADLERFEAAAKKYYTGDEEKELNKAYREANREVFGAEYALKVYNKDVYEKAVEVNAQGANYDVFYDYYFNALDMKDIEKRKVLMSLPVSAQERSAVYYTMLASDKEVGVMDTLKGSKADMGEVYLTLSDMKDSEKSAGKRNALLKSKLKEAVKIHIYTEMVSDTHEKRINALKSANLSFDAFLVIQDKYSEIDAQPIKATEKATNFTKWVNARGYSQAQNTAIDANFNYYMQMQAGSDIQMNTTAEYQLSELNATAQKKYKQAADMKIPLDVWLGYYYSLSGLSKKDEKLAAIDALNLTAAQKDTLYFSEGYAASTLQEAPWNTIPRKSTTTGTLPELTGPTLPVLTGPTLPVLMGPTGTLPELKNGGR